MTARSKKPNIKYLLTTTGRRHLETIGLERPQATATENAWDYNEFVGRLLEIIAILRAHDKQKNIDPEE